MPASILSRLLTTIAFLLLYTCVHAQTIDPEANSFDAFDQHDYEALLIVQKESGERSLLANATISSMLFVDDEAEEKLLHLIKKSSDPAITARARRSLSGVYVRQGKYAAAARTMTEIINMDDTDGVTMDAQSVAFFTALSAVSPMQLSGKPSGSSRIVHDKAGLPRLDIKVNGFSKDAIFDTGAALSTINVSTANALGLRQLGGRVDVDGTTGKTVSTGLAVADSVSVDGFIFQNVPFIVVPDESMSFPEFDYQVSLIMGLPLISKLGRLVFSKKGSSEELTFAPSDRTPSTETANMITSGWQLVIMARINNAYPRQRLFFDSGSKSSQLYQFIGKADPGLLANTEKKDITVGGLGEVVKTEAQSVEQVLVELGGHTFKLGPLTVLEDDGSFRHGVLGQDLFSQFNKVVIDFGAMEMTLHDPIAIE